MNDIEAQEFLRLQQTVVEKVVAAQTSDVWRTAAATCRYVDSSGGTTEYYIRLAASPSPSITSPSSLNDLDANDFIVKKLNAGAVDVGDAVVLHYAGNLNTAYFLSTGECGSSREIPFTWAQIKAKIAAGDFTGLRVGDYKDITLNGTFYDAAAKANKTITNNVFRMEIAGIDSYYRYADTNVPHHIDFISRDCLAGNLRYNATATNSGAYIGSALFTTLNNGTNGLVNLLPADLVAVIIQKRGLTEIKTGATASGWTWNDIGKLWLPTEQEVWGHVTWAEHGYGGGLSVHYPIFQDGLRHIVKGDGNGGGRCGWWCASSVAGSASNFCFVAHTGNPTNASATNATARVPLCFRVA